MVVYVILELITDGFTFSCYQLHSIYLDETEAKLQVLSLNDRSKDNEYKHFVCETRDIF